MKNICGLSKRDLNRLKALVTKCEHHEGTIEHDMKYWRNTVQTLQKSLRESNRRAKSYRNKLVKIKELRQANKIKIVGVDYDNVIERELHQLKLKQKTQNEEIEAFKKQNLALIAKNNELNNKFEQMKMEKLQNEKNNDAFVQAVRHKDELLDAMTHKCMILDAKLREFTQKDRGLNAVKIEKTLKDELDYIDCEISCCLFKLEESETRKQTQIGNLRALKMQIEETKWNEDEQLPSLLR